MQDLTGKTTGSTLTATEWNQLPGEVQNVITALGISLSDSDLNQLGKAVAGYVANGSFYVDSGTASNFTLSPVGGKQTPPAYTDGMAVSFIATNGLSGAATVNVAGLGSQPINRSTGGQVDGTENGEPVIEAGGLVELRYSSSAAAFILRTAPDLVVFNAVTENLRQVNWVGHPSQVGNSLAVAGVGGAALAALNGTDIAFIDDTNDELRTYRFDGTDWSQVGNSLAVANVGGPALAALSGNRVAFIDGTNDELRTYDFDGTDWSQVGNSLAISNPNGPALAALSGNRVAFIDNNADELRTYDFDGTDWSQVGNSLVITSAALVALAALNGTDVAFIDDTNDELRTYRFDGTDWSQVGNSLAISGTTDPVLAALNGTDVAFFDGATSQLRTYRFGGTDWAQVGNNSPVAGAIAPALAALNGTDVAFIDGANDELRTYRHHFALQQPFSAAGGAF